MKSFEVAMSTIVTQLPYQIERYLDRFATRRRWQAMVRAAGVAAAVTIAWTLAWCTIDRLVALPAAMRAVALAVNVGAVASILARPVRRWFGAGDAVGVATEVERREPAFAQRLETVTSRALGRSEWRGSDQLLAALADDVAAEAGRRDPAALLPWRAAMAAWAAVIGLAVFMLALSQSAWLDLPTLLRRYAMPVADVRPVTTTRLRVLPGDLFIHEGDTLRVRVSARGLTDASPVLHVRSSGGETAAGATAGATAPLWSEQVMSVTPDGNFETRVRNVERDLEYFVTGGDASSDVFAVSVLHKPAVQKFRVRYTYPPYTGLAPREIESPDAELEAPAGTQVMLQIEASEPLDVAGMTIGAESIPMTVASAPAPANVATARFTVRENKRFTIRMASKAGVSGAFRGGSIRAIPDRPPVVRFRDSSKDARKVREGVVVPIAYQAVDDFGLARLDAEVSVVRDEGETERRSIAVPIAHAKQEQGVFRLNLSALHARAGDAIELRLRGEDRAGQFDVSAPLRLKVADSATTVPQAGDTTAAVAPATQRADPSLPLAPPGFEEPLRAYFDALRRGK
jgi:hypothetical protein